MKKIFAGMMVGVMAFMAMAVPAKVEAKEEMNMRVLDVENEGVKTFVSGSIIQGLTDENCSTYAKFAHPMSGPYYKQIMYYVANGYDNTTLICFGGRTYDGDWKLDYAYIVDGIVTPTWDNPDLLKQ